MKKVLVINGSPKGKYSITLHTTLYLQKKFKDCSFEFLNAAQNLKSFEKDFTSVLKGIDDADLIIFAYPVYSFLVPAQLHRFIELMHASGVSFKGKFATQISTSKHFYDTTAHEFMRENLSDLGFTVLEGLSADMEDLPTKKGQKDAEKFFSYILWQMQTDKASSDTHNIEKKDKRIALVADLHDDDEVLRSKIEYFVRNIEYKVDVINIRNFEFKGGCTGCMLCSGTGECIYKDGFTDLLRNNINKHDAIVYAFRIVNHSMGSRFKMYDDRQFCNGHRTVMMGAPFAYIVEGDISKEPNLKNILLARAQVGENFLAGIASDFEQIEQMSTTLTYALETSLSLPANFLGVGGKKIFRDLIYQNRGLMRADHKFFKSHGQYDFPHNNWKSLVQMYLVGWMVNNKKVRAKIGNKMNEGMVAKYSKLIENE